MVRPERSSRHVERVAWRHDKEALSTRRSFDIVWWEARIAIVPSWMGPRVGVLGCSSMHFLRSLDGNACGL
ncbi:unnamed protein product [Amoebophrya sp. A25]|nr:unnamed protein product [Amoebophrya sp. A25]|eukprot:GSA25T00023942001.1